MVGHRAGDCRCRLDGVEPVHLPGPRLATGGKVAGIAEPPGAGREEVGVERQDHVGLVEVIADRDIRTEGKPGPRAGLVASGGLVLVPFCLGQVVAEPADLARQRGRGHRFGQDPQPRPLARPRGVDGALGFEQEGVPGADQPPAGDDLRAVGVVERQHGRLGPGVDRAPAIGVRRVPLDHRRPSHVALGEHAGGISGQRHDRCVVERLARHELLGHPHVGHDLLGRLRRHAAAHAGQRQRRPHQLQERPPACPVGPGGRLLGILLVEVREELGRLGQLLQAAPVARPLLGGQAGAERGQVESVGMSSRGRGHGHRWHV